MRETKKPKYLDFYDLEREDLKNIEIYLENTVRYDGRWYFIETKKRYFRDEKESKKAEKIYIKNLYRNKQVLKDEEKNKGDNNE